MPVGWIRVSKQARTFILDQLGTSYQRTPDGAPPFAQILRCLQPGPTLAIVSITCMCHNTFQLTRIKFAPRGDLEPQADSGQPHPLEAKQNGLLSALGESAPGSASPRVVHAPNYYMPLDGSNQTTQVTMRTPPTPRSCVFRSIVNGHSG